LRVKEIFHVRLSWRIGMDEPASNYVQPAQIEDVRTKDFNGYGSIVQLQFRFVFQKPTADRVMSQNYLR
jgi:hypothetical protein